MRGAPRPHAAEVGGPSAVLWRRLEVHRRMFYLGKPQNDDDDAAIHQDFLWEGLDACLVGDGGDEGGAFLLLLVV